MQDARCKISAITYIFLLLVELVVIASPTGDDSLTWTVDIDGYSFQHKYPCSTTGKNRRNGFTSMVDNATRKNSVVLMFGDQEICLQEDWTQGIGGGLWSTGMALATYFGTDHS